MGDFGRERIFYCFIRICIFFEAQGTIFAFERQILDQRDNEEVDLNNYYEKKLVELRSRLDYLWNVNVILGGEKEVTDDIFLDKYFILYPAIWMHTAHSALDLSVSTSVGLSSFIWQSSHHI